MSTFIEQWKKEHCQITTLFYALIVQYTHMSMQHFGLRVPSASITLNLRGAVESTEMQVKIKIGKQSQMSVPLKNISPNVRKSTHFKNLEYRPRCVKSLNLSSKPKL